MLARGRCRGRRTRSRIEKLHLTFCLHTTHFRIDMRLHENTETDDDPCKRRPPEASRPRCSYPSDPGGRRSLASIRGMRPRRLGGGWGPAAPAAGQSTEGAGMAIVIGILIGLVAGAALAVGVLVLTGGSRLAAASADPPAAAPGGSPRGRRAPPRGAARGEGGGGRGSARSSSARCKAAPVRGRSSPGAAGREGGRARAPRRPSSTAASRGSPTARCTRASSRRS